MRLYIAVIALLNAIAVYGMEELDLLEMLIKKSQECTKRMRAEYIADSQREELWVVLKDSQGRRRSNQRWIKNNVWAIEANRKHGFYGLFELSISLEKECNKYGSIELFIEKLSDEQVSERYKQYKKEK